MLADIGVYGLGTMGSALALNLAENGFAVAVTNRETAWIDDFVTEADDLAGQMRPHHTLADFVAGLKTPRVMLFMIPSGAPMDQMIDQIAPLLDAGDTIIDGGNADFRDTIRREAALRDQGLHFVGMGVSGGEAGARHGPSMMVGGSTHSWDQLRPMVEAIAADFNGAPCVARVGPDGAGHFVKTVHNGIEYGDMQLISEIVHLMRHGLGQAPAAIGETFTRWNDGPLESYLVEITGKLLSHDDPETGQPVIDVIEDAAGQKGTGRWTVIEAVRMGQAATIIEAAVAARSWSSEKATRSEAARILGDARGTLDLTQHQLEEALLAARVLDYAQGFRILGAASAEFDWELDMARIAEIWRAGCIIRSALLDDIAAAFRGDMPGGQLFLSDAFCAMLNRAVPSLRAVVAAAVAGGHAVPGLAAALGFHDTMRQARGHADVIQAQRDWFGRHGFARVGAEGRHHGPWWD